MSTTLGLLTVAAAVGAFLTYKNNLGFNFTVPSWEESSTKVSQIAGPVLKTTLPFITAACVTFILSALSVKETSKMIYTKETVDKSGKLATVVSKSEYEKLSTPGRLGRAGVLTMVGTLVGAGLGGAMMKAATSTFELSPQYFRNSTLALAAIGFSVGAFASRHYHLQGTVTA